jgi:hypothetical protein
MSHSKGPWEVNQYSNYEGYSISAEKRGCIAERWYPTELDEQENAEMAANAQLIAAAPELLDALKEAQGQLYKLGVRMGHVEAALAKATGKELR